MTTPKIVSVDDHVVEPRARLADLAAREAPREGTARRAQAVGAVRAPPGREVHQHRGPRRRVGRRLDTTRTGSSTCRRSSSPSRSSATPGGDVEKFDRTTMTMTAVTYDGMRDGCYDRDARVKDFELNWVDGSLPFPTFPRFCGQTFFEANDKELALACVEGLQRLDGRGVVRAVRRHEHPALPHAALGRRPRGRARSSATRHGVCARSASASSRPASTCRASTPVTGTRCSPCATTPASRCACTSVRRRPTPRRHPTRPRASAARSRSTTRWRRSPTGCSAGKLIEFPKLKLAYSEGQIGWIPYALERADTVWDQHDAWQHSKEIDPGAAVDLLLRPHLRLLHRGPRRSQQPRHGRCRQHLLRDRLPPHRHDVAELEGLRREDDRRRRASTTRPRTRCSAATRSACSSSTASEPLGSRRSEGSPGVATYVLVHGGGHGGWCYQPVARILRSAGHEVYTPTLTGLGERSHLLSPDDRSRPAHPRRRRGAALRGPARRDPGRSQLRRHGDHRRRRPCRRPRRPRSCTSTRRIR